MGANATTLELLIQIREELAGLRRTRTELQGAKKDANEFYEAFKSGIGIAGGMQLFSGALSAARGLLQGLVGDVARMAGEIKDSSEALSISTTELQALRIALGNAGLDSSRLSMAIAEQTRSLAEARDTSSGAAQAYRTLGLDAAALERLPVAERLLLTANAANQATDRVLAFSAASNLLGARDLPRLLSALQDVSAGGLTASIATLQAQGEIASPEAISRIDRLTKSWEQYGRQVKVTASELVNFTQAAFEGGAGPDQATIDRIIYGKGQRTPWPWETTPATSTAQPGAAPATAPAPAVDTEAAAAAERRLYVTEQLKRAQADLVTLLDRAGVEQANEALTTEERAGAREQALRDEVAMRTSILELLQQSQQWDFRDNTAKEADIAKAQSELQRAQNALAAQGNTAAQQQVRELFRLETEALAAEAAGNTRIAEQKREQIKQLQLSAQLESQQPELVQARIAAERQLTEAKRTRAAQELDFSRQLGNVEQAIALVEADNALTEEERRRRILPLLAEQNRLIRERIALLEQDTRLQQGDQTALDLQKTIDDLRKQLAETQAQEVDAASPETLAMRDAKGVRSLSDPTQHYQSVADGAAGAGQRFIAQIGTDGDIAAEAISGGLNSALSDTVSWLDQLAQGAITFQEFWSGAIGYVGDMFRKMAIEMVAKMLWRSTVERALVWL
ncbi:MAG TPA: hypothetical protein VK163_12940, partial [Opitutaceae bacterium]|nr:hypothetical protein [Opitutaceae bacterium]